jgi:nitroreductase
MDLVTTLRTTGAIRQFTDEPVGDEALVRILDTARFAPNGGNRQAWRVVVVQDGATRDELAAAYAGPWNDYLALSAAGMTPWSPLADPADEAAVIEAAGASDEVSDMVLHLFHAPVVLVVLAELGNLVATDRDLGRHTMAVGASIYPFAWSVLLAARAEDLGGVMTTMHARVEPRLRELLSVPPLFAVAAVLVIGHPVQRPTKLRRIAVPDFVTVDRFDGPSFGAPPS